MTKLFPLCMPRSVIFFTALVLSCLLPRPTCSIPVTTRVGEACVSNHDCSSFDEYCADDFKCTTIPYNALITTSGKAASSDTTAFSLIMATDPQFYFKICKNEPLEDCIFYKKTRNSAYRSRLLRAASEKQIDCITALASSLNDVKAVFDNGDLVNKGKAREVRDLDTYFHKLISLPLVLGLGNHDYGIDDYSKGYSVEGRRDMINYLADAIIDLNATFNIRSIDFNRSGKLTNAVSGNEEVYNKGSLCYSVDFNDYVFIMLHWSTAVTTGPYKSVFQADDTLGRATKTEYFKITSPETWLKAELDDIQKHGKKAILVPHSYKGLLKFTQKVTDMTNFLRDSEVIAVLSGHVHDAWGYDQDMVVGEGTTRHVPVYYAGSASYEKLIVLELEADKGGLTITPYNTANGQNCAPTTDANSTVRFIRHGSW